MFHDFFPSFSRSLLLFNFFSSIHFHLYPISTFTSPFPSSINYYLLSNKNKTKRTTYPVLVNLHSAVTLCMVTYQNTRKSIVQDGHFNKTQQAYYTEKLYFTKIRRVVYSRDVSTEAGGAAIPPVSQSQKSIGL